MFAGSPFPGSACCTPSRRTTAARSAVVAHRTGTSDLVSSPTATTTTARRSPLRLDEDEAHTLAELLGGTRIIESIVDLDDLPGVPIDWFTVDYDDAIARTDHRRGARRRAGVAIVAVVRGDYAHSAPNADFVVHEADSLVAAGPAQGIDALFRALRDGDGLAGSTAAVAAESPDA